MQKIDLINIEDILTSIYQLELHVAGIKPEIFFESIDVQDKALFRLILIGETAGKISDELQKSHPEIPWKKITGLRNIIVHDYTGVALERVWNTIMHAVPETKEQFIKLKHELESETSGR